MCTINIMIFFKISRSFTTQNRKIGVLISLKYMKFSFGHFLHELFFYGWNISFDASLVIYTECNRRNGPDFGRVFLLLNYTEKPQNTYIQS